MHVWLGRAGGEAGSRLGREGRKEAIGAHSGEGTRERESGVGDRALLTSGPYQRGLGSAAAGKCVEGARDWNEIVCLVSLRGEW